MNENKALFATINMHLMNDEQPSVYLNKWVEEDSAKGTEFELLRKLKTIPQSPIHHPEGNVWNHTMNVVDQAAKVKEQSEDPQVFMWSALLHDVGKITKTKVKKGKIIAYDHDIEGETVVREFLQKAEVNEEFIEKVAKLVRWHMQPFFVLKELPFANVDQMKEETSVREVAYLSLCDRMGRGSMTQEEKAEVNHNTEQFIKIVNRK